MYHLFYCSPGVQVFDPQPCVLGIYIYIYVSGLRFASPTPGREEVELV